MGNVFLKAFVRVFLPLIVFVLAIVALVALIKMCCRRESERNSDDYLAREIVSKEIDSEPIEKSF